MRLTKDNLLILGAAAAAGLLVWFAWKGKGNGVPGIGVFGVDWHYGPNFEIVKGGYVSNDNIGDADFWASLGL